MKASFRSIYLALLAMLVLAFPTIVQAAGNSRLELSAHPAKVRIGETFTVEVHVRNALPIYGADVSLSFDPQVLEVIDADQSQVGIQITPGTFIDPTRSFILRHVISNQDGTIHYALALLNPAPEAKGNGTLLSIPFRAKASGTTTITIASGKFGTRTGKTIVPDLDSAEVRILADKKKTEAVNPGIMITGLSGTSLMIVGFVGVRLWRHRSKQS